MTAAQNAGGGYGSVQNDVVVETYDIFEGTEQIQQLVISRAISGMRIE